MKWDPWIRRFNQRLLVSSKKTLRRASHLQRRVESLEHRCLLTENAELLPSAEWFASVHAAEPTGSVGWLQAASGSTSVVSGDVIVGTWIVQLSHESLTTIKSPSAADAVFDGYGADFKVLRGLGLPGQVLIQASVATRDRAEHALKLNPLIEYFEPDTVIFEPQSSSTLTPNDPRFDELAGLNNTGQGLGLPGADINAPEAWGYVNSKLAPDAQSTKVGDHKVVVAVLDTAVDQSHPDLVFNLFLNNGEIPGYLRNPQNQVTLLDVDHDKVISFVDLNDSQNKTVLNVVDKNNNGLIDPFDLRADVRWANGQDNDLNGFIDDISGWDFESATYNSDGTFTGGDNGDNDPSVSPAIGTKDPHGTHVAGIIGAVGNNGRGVTGGIWNVSLLAVRHLNEQEKGSNSAALSAINYTTMMKQRYLDSVADPKIVDGSVGANVRVSNNSWGGNTNTNRQGLREAIKANAAVDILFVAAAGNGSNLRSGSDNDVTAFFPANYDLDNIISVTGTNSLDQFITTYNFGVRSVDLAAPAIVKSTFPRVSSGNADSASDYGELSGTSQATPHVSAVAALIAALAPEATYSEIKAAILSSVDPLPTLSTRVKTGGRLNAEKAVMTDTIRPQTQLQSVFVPNVTATTPAQERQRVEVRYKDTFAINRSSIDAQDVFIARAGTNDTFAASLDLVTPHSDAAEYVATYSFAPPDGSWEESDNGTYSIHLRDAQVRDTSGNFASGRVIGSFRVDIPHTGQIELTSTVDSVDANLSDNNIVADINNQKTLRAAVMESNRQPGDNTIVMPPGTYRLTLSGNQEDSAVSGDLDVTGTLTVVGSKDGSTIIDANGLDRIFDVQPGANLTLQDLTITGGRIPTNESGGGIRNQGTLTLINVTVYGNVATLDGGGIAATTGTTTAIRNSTLSTNQAGRGGAFASGGNATLLNATIAFNSATTGGGIFSDTSAAVTVKNTIVAKNTAATGPDVANAFVSNGNNLIGDATSSTGFSRDIGGNKIGTGSEPIDPLLGSLKNNGGPTLTHELLRGSPAINSADELAAPVADQRGNLRVSEGDSKADIGAFEQILGVLRGVKFHDRNANGVQDLATDTEPAEEGLGGFLIYLDVNHNGQRDTNEPTAITHSIDEPEGVDLNGNGYRDRIGSYEFVGLEPGTYDILEEGVDGFEQTAPFGLNFQSLLLLAGGAPATIATGDFNGDLKPDIVVGNQLTHDLTLFLNSGKDSFLAPVTIPLNANSIPVALAVEDFDNNGRVDIAVADQFANTVTLLRNLGDNSFLSDAPIPVGARPSSLAVGRLDGNLGFDLAVTNSRDNSNESFVVFGNASFSSSQMSQALSWACDLGATTEIPSSNILFKNAVCSHAT